MGIATDLSRVKSNITAALSAIAEKGVTVPDGSTSDALAGLIASIQAGGGSANNIIAGSFTLAESLTTGSPLYIDVTFHKNEFPLMYCVYEDSSNLEYNDTSHTGARVMNIIAVLTYDNVVTRYKKTACYNKVGTHTITSVNSIVTHNSNNYANAGGIVGSMDISLTDNKIRFSTGVDNGWYLAGRTYNYLLYWSD